jgi:hypothetical protein
MEMKYMADYVEDVDELQNTRRRSDPRYGFVPKYDSADSVVALRYGLREPKLVEGAPAENHGYHFHADRAGGRLAGSRGNTRLLIVV